MRVFAEAEDNGDLRGAGGRADAGHLGRIIAEGILDVCGRKGWVEWSGPGLRLLTTSVCSKVRHGREGNVRTISKQDNRQSKPQEMRLASLRYLLLLRSSDMSYPL